MRVWLAVRDYEGLYEVSSDGLVRSVKTGLVLRPSTHPIGGYQRVNLSKKNKVRTIAIHQLVARSFIGQCPDGMEVRHRTPDPANNSVANLMYGTHQQNELDKVIHGTHNNASKTRCKRGHALEGPNLGKNTGGGRKCLACARANYDMVRHPEWKDRFQEIADAKYAILTRMAKVDARG